MKTRNLFIALFLLLSCTDNSSVPDVEFLLTIDKGGFSSGRVILETNGDVGIDEITFLVNDSLISPILVSEQPYFSIEIGSLPSYDGSPGEVIIRYQGKEEVLAFTNETCTSGRHAYRIDPSSTDKYYLKWRTCNNSPSDYPSFILNTDYSIIELTSKYFDFNTTQFFNTIDTTYISLIDSVLIPLEFVPRFIQTDTSVFRINTSAEIINVTGPLPNEKRYLSNRDLSILFYDRTSHIADVWIDN